MYESTTVILFVVRVPVLSEQIDVAFPIVSQASKWRTKLLSNIIWMKLRVKWRKGVGYLSNGVSEGKGNSQRKSFGDWDNQYCNGNNEEFDEHLNILETGKEMDNYWLECWITYLNGFLSNTYWLRQKRVTSTIRAIMATEVPEGKKITVGRRYRLTNHSRWFGERVWRV